MRIPVDAGKIIDEAAHALGVLDITPKDAKVFSHLLVVPVAKPTWLPG